MGSRGAMTVFALLWVALCATARADDAVYSRKRLTLQAAEGFDSSDLGEAGRQLLQTVDDGTDIGATDVVSIRGGVGIGGNVGGRAHGRGLLQGQQGTGDDRPGMGGAGGTGIGYGNPGGLGSGGRSTGNSGRSTNGRNSEGRGGNAGRDGTGHTQG